MRHVAGFMLAACCFAAFSDAHAATVFNFQFDNQGLTTADQTTDGAIVAPVIGAGTFTSATDLAPGTYALAPGKDTLPVLPGFLLSFVVGGYSYDQTDIATPLAGVAVRIVQSGTGERLFFTESGDSGSDGGPIGGALDLTISGRYLSFEPSFAGGNFAYVEAPFQIIPSLVLDPAGRYCAASAGGVCPTLAATPASEPSDVALLLSGLAMLFTLRSRKRAAVAVAKGRTS